MSNGTPVLALSFFPFFRSLVLSFAPSVKKAHLSPLKLSDLSEGCRNHDGAQGGGGE